MLDQHDEQAPITPTLALLARDALRPVALGLGIYYGVTAASYFVRFPMDVTLPMALIGFATAVALLTFYRTATRQQFPPGWTEPLAAGMGLLVLANMVIQHWGIRSGQHSNFGLLIVGAGFLLLDTSWMVLVIGTTLTVWIVTVNVYYPYVTTADFLMVLAPSLTLGIVAHATRIHTLQRILNLRQQDQTGKMELEKAVHELQHSEDRYRRLSEGTFEGILFHDQGRILDANQTVLTMFGYELSEVIGRLTVEFVAPESREMVIQRAAAQDDTPYEAIGLRQDGSQFPIEIRGRNAGFKDSAVRLVAVRDVSERKRAEEALHQEQQRYKALFNRTTDAVFIISLVGRHVAVNQQAADMLGYLVEEMVGQPVEDFVMPEERDASKARHQRLMTGEIMPVYERTFRRKDGTLLPGEVNAALVTDSEGNPLHIQSVVRDVTERKRTEAERETMIRELESFAHTVAHDLKNPLGLIIAYASLLREDIGVMPVETTRDYAAKMFDGGIKMRTIIEELLLLSQTRYGEIQPVPIDMQPLVLAARERLPLLYATVQPDIRLPDRWPRAMGYGPWIEEVWFNYLSNALKYGGQPPVIELGADTLPGGQVRFWVRDNGAGLAPEQISRLFVPFTQLEQANSQGHGLGLSIVRHIIEKLGGQVGAESCPGQGSRFYFTLPPVETNGV